MSTEEIQSIVDLAMHPYIQTAKKTTLAKIISGSIFVIIGLIGLGLWGGGWVHFRYDTIIKENEITENQKITNAILFEHTKDIATLKGQESINIQMNQNDKNFLRTLYNESIKAK